jgi:hypothetical protein
MIPVQGSPWFTPFRKVELGLTKVVFLVRQGML